MVKCESKNEPIRQNVLDKNSVPKMGEIYLDKIQFQKYTKLLGQHKSKFIKNKLV